MGARGRLGLYAWVLLAVLACVISVGWTLQVLRKLKLDEADSAGVLGLGLSGISVVLTAWGVGLAIRGLRISRPAR